MSAGSKFFSARLVKLVTGLLVAAAFLLLLEGALWFAAAASGADWRVDPLPQHLTPKIVCKQGDKIKICPEERFGYRRVRPEVFSLEPTRPRVIVVGESFVFGLGVDMPQAWPAQLQRHLKDKAQVLNLGRCGTHAGLLVPVFKKALSFKPQVIVLAIGNNEHTMTTFYTGWAGRHPLEVYRASAALGSLQSGGLLFRAIGAPTQAKESFDGPVRHFTNPVDKAIFAARRRPPDMRLFPDSLAGPEVSEALEKEQRLKETVFRGHLLRIMALAKEQGVKVVLATLPFTLQAPPTLSGAHKAPTADVLPVLRTIRERPSQDKVDRALAVDDTVALFHYVHGELLLREGKAALAADAFRRSAQWDMIPDTTPAINTIIREVARKHDAPLVDLAQFAERYMARPRDVFIDRVHLNPKGCDEVGGIVAGAVGKLLK